MRTLVLFQVAILAVAGTSVWQHEAAADEKKPLFQGKEQQDSAHRFREYIKNQPFIELIIFRQSGNHTQWAVENDEPKPLKEFAGFEGALQPGGFYLKHLSNSVAYIRPKPDRSYEMASPEPGKEFINGESDKFFWQLSAGHQGVSMSPKLPEEGQSPRNGREILCKQQKERLQKAALLGMGHLLEAKIEWIEQSRFSGETKTGRVEGEILSYNNGKPSQIRYVIEEKEKREYRVDLNYLLNRDFPPYEIISYEMIKGTPAVKYTNYIENLKTGSSQHPERGYSPSDFQVDVSNVDSLIIWSNGARFKVERNAEWHPIRDSPPDYSSLMLKEPGKISRLVVLVLFLLATIGGLLAMIAIARKHQGNKHKQH